MPTSVCSTSPRWMTPDSPQNGASRSQRDPTRCRFTSGKNQIGRPSDSKRSRMYQATSWVVVTPGVMTRLLKASAITARAMETICG